MMDNPCKICLDADAGQPVSAFDPRCDSGCSRFDDYVSSGNRAAERFVAEADAIINRYNGEN